MTKKYLDNYVVVGMTVALIILLWMLASIFLSSGAEARRGSHTGKSVPRITRVDTTGVDARSVGSLPWIPITSAFDRQNAPVPYLLEWPRIPPATDVLIRNAKTRLADFMEEGKKQAAEKQKAVELKYDWEAFQKAGGLFFICVGVIFTAVYGAGGRPKKKGPYEKVI